MASVLAFDTHAYIKKLRDAGVSEEQAEIQTEVLVALLDGFLASRRELAEQELSLKRDIKELDGKMETRIKELETRLLTRLGSLLFIGIGLLATLIKLL